MKILIVEDEAITSMSLAMYIKRTGIDVCGIAPSSTKAIELVKSENPDVIIMDSHLQDDVSGIETVKKIKEFSDAKIVFWTGASGSTIEEMQELHPLAIVKKPANIESFIKMLWEIAKKI